MSESDQRRDVWQAVTTILRDQLTESAWFSTFQDAERVDDGADALIIEVPNNLARERILSRYRSMLDDALVEAGHAGMSVEVRIGSNRLDIPDENSANTSERTVNDEPSTPGSLSG